MRDMGCPQPRKAVLFPHVGAPQSTPYQVHPRSIAPLRGDPRQTCVAGVAGVGGVPGG